jgi:hypothetical protein
MAITNGLQVQKMLLLALETRLTYILISDDIVLYSI